MWTSGYTIIKVIGLLEYNSIIKSTIPGQRENPVFETWADKLLSSFENHYSSLLSVVIIILCMCDV